MSPTTPPFIEAHQLCCDLDPYALPGQPCVLVSDATHVKHFLIKELWAHNLEAIAPRLWVMSTQSSANVNPLHGQRVKGRKILVTEDPRLHLVWIHDRIFIKPLPRYLLSHAFWEQFVLSKSSILTDRRDAIRMAAMGYLRTYRYLIQHEFDFVIAQQDDLRLVPKDVNWTIH